MRFVNSIFKFKSSVEIVNLIIFITNIINIFLITYLFLKNGGLKLFIIAPGSLFLVFTDEIHLYGRLDIISYFFLLLQFTFQTSKKIFFSTLKFQIPFLSISYFILPFIHEGFIFLYFPASIILFYIYHGIENIKTIIPPVISIILSYILIVLATLLIRVNYEDLFNNLSLIDKSLICNNCQGPITSYDFGYYYAMKSNGVAKESFIDLIYQIATFNIWYWISILMLIYVYFYLTCDYLNKIRNSILSCLLIITIPVLLLCVIAIDFGRFFGIIVMNSFLFFLLPSEFLQRINIKLSQNKFLQSINWPLITIKVSSKLMLVLILFIIGLGTPVAYTTGAKPVTYKNNFILIIKDHIFPKKYFR